MKSVSAYRDAGLVLAAAGSGVRFGGERGKIWEPLGGKPLFLHVLERFARVIPPCRCIVVSDPRQQSAFTRALAAIPGGGDMRVVPGGATRAESVCRGLEALTTDPGIRCVAVQDAARPASSLDLLERCLASARERGSGVAAHPVTDTIKIVDEQHRVVSTPDRRTLWAAETPQVFRLAELYAAYRQALERGLHPTDDAGALEAAGGDVYLVPSSSPNPKITYPGDLEALRQV